MSRSIGFGRGLCWAMLLSHLLSCGDDAETDRFFQAETLSQSWCLEAQLQLSSMESANLGREHIDLEVFTDARDMTQAKASIDPNSDKPIVTKGLVKSMKKGLASQAPDMIAKEVLCKLKSQEGIERGLNMEIDGPEGSCRQMNQRALDWAYQHLSQSEQTRYQNEGVQLKLAEDVMSIAGAEWYAAESDYVRSGSSITLSARALLVPYDEYPDMPDDLRGVHYCKLLPPSQMLYWMRYRAFFDNPLGAGPTRDADAALVTEPVADCRLQDISPLGSCIFHFSVSAQHFCEEYTGPDWDLASIEKRCAGRDQAVFSSSLCADRLAETSQLDNDGEYKGECVINCGESDEYRWKVYSKPDNMEIDAACGASWFAAP